MKSVITSYTDYCIFCGKTKTDIHHCIYGTSNRKLCDEDGIVIPTCRDCHEEIHKKSICGFLSKMFGQAIFERNECAKGSSIEDARKLFRKRYGRSYL
jgi:hypothetical protein